MAADCQLGVTDFPPRPRNPRVKMRYHHHTILVYMVQRSKFRSKFLFLLLTHDTRNATHLTFISFRRTLPVRELPVVLHVTLSGADGGVGANV